jgi:outer membrane protein assembly factor BamD
MTRHRNILLITTAALLLSAGLACKKPTTGKPKDKENAVFTSAQLLIKGENELKRKKWEEGRKTLRFLEENLPGTPEFPKAKLLLGDSFFFANTSSYPEALVEYEGFLNYFPRHEKRDYVLYHIALCHYASIESAERDQTETRKALAAFNRLLEEAPGSAYAVDARAKVLQCWRRLAESELQVGIHYVNAYHFGGAEKRLKDLLTTYPEYVDRERAYFYLGEALRLKLVPPEVIDKFQKDFMARIQKDDAKQFTKAELDQFKVELEKLMKDEVAKYREEAKGYFQKLVESYSTSPLAGRARDRLLEMGQGHVKEELDS